MIRLLSLALCLGLASCDSTDPFDAEGGSFSATARGAVAADFSGEAVYAVARESPLTTSILLSGSTGPTVEFLFDGGSVRGIVYNIPADARATFEVERFSGEAYQASGGRVEITRVTETRAQGTFSFTAERGGETVTVQGDFVAVR